MGCSNGFPRRALLGLTLAGLLGAGACYPGEIEGVIEPDVVLTAFDPLASFDSYATYAMPDTIVRVDDRGSTFAPDPDLDQQILDAVATELTALGYTRIPDDSPTAPDVTVLLTVNEAEIPFWSNDLWWTYWGWYPGWATWHPEWSAGWRLQYPWAETYPGVRRPGTLVVSMIDADQPVTDSQSIPVVWAGAIDALFTGTQASVISRFQGLIRRAFDQSPYL